MKCVHACGIEVGVFRRVVPAAMILLALSCGVTTGQVGVGDYPKPILTRNGLTHYATIKDLVFARDGKELLSAGLDKVIHVWDVENRSTRPIRTLRPPIFKGEAGQIWSIALSPVEEEGQRLLAVAGHSPGTDVGSIVLMRYPGRGPLNAGGTGEILGYLQNPKGRNALESESSSKITKLAFLRRSQSLVSADASGSIYVWDLSDVGKTRVGIEAVSKIEPFGFNPPLKATSAILGMVLAGDVNNDRWIVTGDANGRIIRFDVTNREGPGLLPFNNPNNFPITCLGGGGGLPWVVAGTWTGELWKIDVANRFAPILIRSAQQGRILAVDVSSDGRKIAVSVRRVSSVNVADPPPIDACDVVLYESNDGVNWPGRFIEKAKYPIETVRFGPNRLAFGGDDDQAVTVLDGPNFATQPMKVPGQGSVIWDVGFVNQPGRAIVVSRNAADYQKKRGAGLFNGFDLTRRELRDYPANLVFRSDPARLGFRVAVLSGFRFQITGPQINRTIDLDPLRDGRWYSYAFIPPLVAGGAPMMAIGTEFGISIFNLVDGKRTRFLQAHEATVTALEVSPDGKWLVSGSADQSVRLWSTKDFDRVTGFGIKASVQGAQLVVTEVAEGSVAQQRGLLPRDMIDTAYVQSGPGGLLKSDLVPLDQFVARAEALEADREIRLVGKHASNAPLNFFSKKRQPPTLSLFLEKPGSREWVLWAPQGYYATSIDGDDRYLGWHRNVMRPGFEASLFFPDTEATAFAPIAAFRQQFQDNNFIDRLISSNNPVDVPSRPIAKFDVIRPATLAQEGPIVTASLPVEPSKPDPLRPEVFADARPIPPGEIGWVRLGASYVGTLSPKAVNSLGASARIWVRRVEGDARSAPSSLEFTNRDAVPRPGRLVVFSTAVEEYPRFADLKVPGATRDVEALWAFFGDRGHLVSPGDGKPFAPASRVLIQPRGEEVKGTGSTRKSPRFKPPSSQEFLAKLETLAIEAELSNDGRPPLQDGDVAMIHIEAGSLFNSAGEGQLLLHDSGAKTTPAPVSTDLIRERLAGIAKTGCRVFVFLDIVHDENQDKDTRDRWIRQLIDDGVNCFLASKDRPSLPGPDESATEVKSRLFARSILAVFDRESGNLTFDQFASRVRAQAIRVEGESLDSDFFRQWSSPLVDPRDLFLTSNGRKR